MLIALPFCLIPVLQVIEYVFVSPRARGGLADWLYLAAAVLFFAAMCAQAWFGITLTPSGLVVHSFRRTTIAWNDVTAIRAEEYSANQVVAIYELGHRRTRLRYPTSGPLFRDHQFDEKLAIIQDSWASATATATAAATAMAPDRATVPGDAVLAG